MRRSSRYDRSFAHVDLPAKVLEEQRRRAVRLMKGPKPKAPERQRPYSSGARSFSRRGAAVLGRAPRNVRWQAYGYYMERGRAQPDGEKALGFDASHDDILIARTANQWQLAGDARGYRLILSPEDQGIDMQRITREVMAGLEQDLGTRLEWVGVVHHNTAHIHAHILIRGLDQEGQELAISTTWAGAAARDRLCEALERELGPRLEIEQGMERS